MGELGRHKEEEKSENDGLQLFCRIIWSRDRSSSEPIASNDEHLSNYPEISKESVVFDKYQDISAKDHERMQQASGTVLDYDLSIASHLP